MNRAYFNGLKVVGQQAVFDSDYQAILDYATAQGFTLPSASQQQAGITLITKLKNIGVWEKLKCFYVPATDGDEDFACINWKNTNEFNITRINSPLFTTNDGFTAQPTTRLNTGFNPFTYNNWAAAEQATFGFFGDVVTNGTYTIGNTQGFGQPSFGTRFFHSPVEARFGLGENTTSVTGQGAGNNTFRQVQRNGTQSIYYNDTAKQVTTQSGNYFNGNVDLMPGGLTDEKYLVGWIADFLTETESLDFRLSILSYLNAL